MHDDAGLPRTLTQMLREWDDKDLCDLLMARPDLAFPEPGGFSQVASRATMRHSVQTVLDNLTTAEIFVAQAASHAGGPFAGDDLVTSLATAAATASEAAPEADEAAIRAALERLWSLCLVWGTWRSLRPVRAMSALLDEPPRTPPALHPPSFEHLPRQKPSTVDKVAAGSAFEFVRRMDVLVEHLDHHPARLTRAGSITSRDLRGLAELLDAPTVLAQVYLEVALAAGLVGLAARDLTEVLLPTRRFDAWQDRSLAEQWVELVTTWRDNHPPSGTPAMKRLCFELYGHPADGRSVTAADLKAYLSWHRPRRPSNADKRSAAMIDQAAAFGVTGLGALASYASPLSADGLAAHLPDRVDQVLIQADLTAIAPGPLTPEAAADLGTLADVESRGGATVYRFSPASLTRAQALGWSSDDILETLTVRSRTPVPQPLEYQVRELDRRKRRGEGPRAAEQLMDAENHRAPERADPPVDTPEQTARKRLDAALVEAIVAALRHDTHEPRPDRPESSTTADHFWAAPVDTLREAVETQEMVWLGYVDAEGTARERVVQVTGVDEGQVSARDTHGHTFTLAVHRISAAHIIRAKR